MFYAPIQVENFSEVFYRETTNQSFLELATGHVRSSFTKEGNFAATEVFIVTWKNVPHVDNRFPNEVRKYILADCGLKKNVHKKYVNHHVPSITLYHILFSFCRYQKNENILPYSLTGNKSDLQLEWFEILILDFSLRKFHVIWDAQLCIEQASSRLVRIKTKNELKARNFSWLDH